MVELEATLGLVTQVVLLLSGNLRPISNSSTNLFGFLFWKQRQFGEG